MPTYDYTCQQCGKPFERRLSIAEYSTSKASPCPHCGSSTVTRKFTPVHVAAGSHTESGPAPSCDGGSCCCG